jgi:PEGA domain-containing protein
LKKTISRLYLPATALALALCAGTVPATAQTTTAKPAPTGTAGARQLFNSGETKYKAGDYAGALNDFEAADAIKAAPQAARFIGLCQDKLGHYADAVAAYERFLADVPAKLAGEADAIKSRIAEIKAMPGRMHIDSSPPGATVTLDGKPQASPTPFDIDVSAGTHAIHATLGGHDPADKTVTVAFASKQDVSLQLNAAAPAQPPVVAVVPVVEAPPPAAPPPPPPPPEPHSKLPALITGGLAIVAAGVGTAFGIVTLNDHSTFVGTGAGNHTEATAETGQNHALVSDMSFGVAITLGVTSVVLLLTKDESDTSKETKAASAGTIQLSSRAGGATLSAAPIISPHGGGAGALLRF